MRKARKALVGVAATALLVAVALALPASSAIAAADVSGSPVASQAKKKKCKKKGKKGKKGKKCKKGKRGGAGSDIPEGAVYRGTTSQGESFSFTVRNRAAAVDPISLYANCFDGRDYSTSLKYGVAVPGAAFPIGPDGSFSGEGKDESSSNSPRYKVSGRINGASAQGELSLHWEEVGFSFYPYYDTWLNFCGGQVSWTGQRQ
jgi:hypothetical protein